MKLRFKDVIPAPGKSFNPKKVALRVGYIAAPAVLSVAVERFLQGRLYVKFQFPDETSFGVFLKNHCTSITKSERYLQNDWLELRNQDKKYGSRAFYKSLCSGNIFLSDNGNIIFTKNKKKKRGGGHARQRDNLVFYIVGPNFYKDVLLLKKYEDKEVKELFHNSIRAKMTTEFYTTSIRVKPIEGVFSDQKEEVFQEIDRILYKFNVSKQFVISSCSGIMLHGIPGTGKSLVARSIIRYIDRLGKYDYTETIFLTKANMKNKKLLEKLKEELAEDDDDAINILVIDDCDLLMKSREIDDEQEGKKNLTADLMSILDNGIPGLTNPLLVIMTTNHLNKIDHAILRPGRTDAIIEMKNIRRDTAEDMCSHYKVDLEDLGLQADDDQTFNPAQLQQAIINKLSEV